MVIKQVMINWLMINVIDQNFILLYCQFTNIRDSLSQKKKKKKNRLIQFHFKKKIAMYRSYEVSHETIMHLSTR